jgi:hypothetical protein
MSVEVPMYMQADVSGLIANPFAVTMANLVPIHMPQNKNFSIFLREKTKVKIL